MNAEDVTREVNFYHKNVCHLNEHYRLQPISTYMADNVLIAREMPNLPYAYACLNEPNSFTRLIRENEANDLIVGEGLLKTYPANKALRVFKKFCKDNLPIELYDLKLSDTELVKLPQHGIRVIDSTDDEFENGEIVSKLWFRFPFYDKDDLSRFIKKLSDAMFVCGYSYASSHRYRVAVQPFENKLTLVALLFEAKYFEEEFSWSDYVYHVTTQDKLKKIKKHGLVPMSKSSRFEYPERVYVFNNATQQIMFDYIENKARATNADHMAILKIKSSKLRESSSFKTGAMKFFIDHMFEQGLSTRANALFTYDVISPTLLEDDMLLVDLDNGYVQSTRIEKLKNVTSDLNSKLHLQ